VIPSMVTSAGLTTTVDGSGSRSLAVDGVEHLLAVYGHFLRATMPAAPCRRGFQPR